MKRVSLACMVAGAVLLSLVVPSVARAFEAPPEEGVGSFVLSATGGGVEVFLGDSVDGSVPNTAATLETGGIGYARASVAWPGSLGANAGDLVILASGGEIPPEMEPTFRTLNYPVRAEARAPGGPEEESFGDVPGVTMDAAAAESRSAAASDLQSTEVPGLVRFAGGSSESVSELTDVATADAVSTLSDVELGGGLITIESVTSTATATSDGQAASGSGETVLSGVTVAGVPATIDEHGLRLQESEVAPLGDAANEIAEQTIAQAQLEVYVTQPVVEVEGPAASVSSGSVLVVFGGQGEGVAVLFGGTTASASASPPFSFPLEPLPEAPIEVAPAPPVELPEEPPLPEEPMAFDAPPAPVATSSGSGPAPRPLSVAPPPRQPQAPSVEEVPAAPSFSPVAFFGHGNPVWLGLVGALLGAVVARGLRRFGLCIADDSGMCPLQGGAT